MTERVARGALAAWAHREPGAGGLFHTVDAVDLGDGRPPRTLHVYQPDPDRDDAPVLLLLDGDVAFWRGGPANATWDAARVADRSRARPVVVALRPVDRNAEYTHTDWAHGERSWGGLPTFAEGVAERVVPLVASAFGLRPRGWGVGGSSHGGLAAFWLATRHPDRFSEGIALSASFFSGLDSLRDGGLRGAARLSHAAIVTGADALLRDRSRRPRLWLSWGSRRDGGEHNRVVEALAAWRGQEMVELLRGAYGYDRTELRAWVDPLGGHDEAAWSWQLALAIDALWRPVAR